MYPLALVLEWFSYMGRKLGRVRENVFLLLEAQVAGLGIYTTWVCQTVPQSCIAARFGCVESACVTLRGKAVSPPMPFVPTSLSMCEYGPLGLVYSQQGECHFGRRNVTSLSNTFGNIPLLPSGWKAAVYYGPIWKDECCIFMRNGRRRNWKENKRRHKRFFSFRFLFAKLKFHVAKGRGRQWGDHPAGVPPREHWRVDLTCL